MINKIAMGLIAASVALTPSSLLAKGCTCRTALEWSSRKADIALALARLTAGQQDRRVALPLRIAKVTGSPTQLLSGLPHRPAKSS